MGHAALCPGSESFEPVDRHASAQVSQKADGLAPRERIAIALARESFQRHRIPDDLFAAAQAEWGTAGFVELVTTLGYYGMLAMLLNAADVEPEPGTPRLPLS